MYVVAPNKSINAGKVRIPAGTEITEQLLAKGVLSERDVEVLVAQGVLVEKPEPAEPPQALPQRSPIPRWDGYDPSRPESIIYVPVRDLAEALAAVDDLEQLEAMAEAEMRRESEHVAKAYQVRLGQLLQHGPPPAPKGPAFDPSHPETVASVKVRDLADVLASIEDADVVAALQDADTRTTAGPLYEARLEELLGDDGDDGGSEG